MWAGDLYRRAVPGALRRRVVEPLLGATPAGLLNVAFQYPAYLGNRGKRKALDYLGLLEPSRIEEAYRHLISLFDSSDTAELYAPDFRRDLEQSAAGPDASWIDVSDDGEPYLNRLLRLQFNHWLPDNMLLRQDKTGMANAIEGRVPYLDHELVEFALRLPLRLKLRRLTGKYILRRYAHRLLPAEVVNRKKMPFYVPIENYFRQESFKALMEELLSEESVRRRGIFQPGAVSKLRGAMHRREFLLVKQVFSLMILELWFRIFVDRTVSVDPPRPPALPS
jgi:asparagine synthase (glutamine-hydrolysing)